MKDSHIRRLGALVLVATLAAGACSGNNGAGASSPSASTGSAPSATAVANLAGEIAIDGSSTVFPISEAVGEEFGKSNPGVKVNVGESGTGGGFKKLCVSDGTDISDASRPIKQEEIELCQAAGVEYVELPVAIDGLTVVINKDNTWAASMTKAQLLTIWEPAAEGKITRWNEVDPAWPNEEIHLYGPGTASGTFNYFSESIMGKDVCPDAPDKCSRGDYTASEDDNVLVQGVAGDKNALGYFGFSYFENNQEKLKAVAVEGVAPSRETIANGTYVPLSRPLFIYINTKALARPEIRAFAEFYLSPAGVDLVKEVQYVELPADVQDLALQRLAAGRTGSAYHVAGFDPRGKALAEIYLIDKS